MALASTIPASITPARRLREFVDLVRDISLQRSPADLLAAYRSRAQFVVAFDEVVSLSRRGLSDGSLRITRSSRWTEPVDPWREQHKLPIVRSGLFRRLMDGGRPVKMDQITVAPDDPAAEHLAGMNSLLASPLYYEGEPTYMLIVMRAEPAAFSLDELCTLVLTSNLVGRATSQLVLAGELHRANAALDREFRAVGDIQRQLLPAELPDIPRVTLATHYETSAQAGGDYYDFFPQPDGRWGVLIADVSGHGVAAAVVMARLHAMLHAPRYVCPDPDASPPDILRRLNQRLLDSMRPGSFVTAFYGLLDPQSLTMRYSLAGHNPPRLLRKASQRIEALELTDGLPLGILKEFDTTERELSFAPGDRMLLYTDGITEAFNARGEEFGIDRLDEALERCQRTPESMIDCVKADLKGHCRDLPPADDRTLVAIAFD